MIEIRKTYKQSTTRNLSLYLKPALKFCTGESRHHDGTLANNGESSIYSDSGDSAIENKQWDHIPFEPELLASLEKDLEQLSREEQHLLKQIDGDSKTLCKMFCAKDNEDVLHSSATPT